MQPPAGYKRIEFCTRHLWSPWRRITVQATGYGYTRGDQLDTRTCQICGEYRERAIAAKGTKEEKDG